MTHTIATAVLLTLSVLPTYAADADDTNAAAVPEVVVPARISQALARPVVLPALYASYVALQAFDVYSTKTALAREANPIMQGVVGNTSTFVAVKAAMAVGTIFAAERLWKTNKVAAIAVMLASNGVAALVAANNARTLRHY